MTDSNPGQDAFPTAGNEIEWLGYRVSVGFHPPIKITRKGGHEFASKIYSAMEAGSTNVDGPEWVFHGAGAYDGMSVRVKTNSIIASVVYPQSAQDWYEERFAAIFSIVGRMYDVKMILSSEATANGLLQTSGDAREFLGGNLMFMHPAKLGSFPRPLHILGLRLYFPPNEETEWGVDVRVESWTDDPTKLYLEADAEWDVARAWNSSERSAASNVQIVTDFMNKNLLQFLHNHPLLGFDDDEESTNE